MLTLVFVLMQYMVSAKAGLVNYVDGQANVTLHEQVAAGTPIQTTAQAHVELLLNPGSFLRIGGGSNVVMDSVELDHIAVRIVEGSALVEAADIDKHAPIRVTTGNLQTLIVSRGLYRFSGGTAIVLDGKLRINDKSTTVKKGHQVTFLPDNYVIQTITTRPSDELDRWSQQRSADLAKANALAYHDRSHANTYSSVGFYPYWSPFINRPAWIYSPLLGGFTFFPLGGYRSYYGYRFVPLSAFGGSAVFPTQTGPNLGRSPGRPNRPAGSVPAGSVSRPRPNNGGWHAPTGGHSPGLRSGGRGHR